MSDRSSWAMGVLVWVLVVLAGSSLVWLVISHAGAGVAPQPGSSVAAGDPAADTAAPTSPPGTRPPKGTATERPTLRPAPAPSRSSPSPSTAATPASPSPPGGSAPEPGDDSEPGSSPAPTTPSASTGTSTSRRTWSGTGGSVVVECTGSRIRLVAAQPDGGFAVQVGNRGPEEVEVAFHGRGEEERESEVHAVCVGGTPRFAAESGRED
jgi:hypothetical protein